jgi:hypothetical protein
MPINADRFEEIDDDDPNPGTNAAEVLSFLRSHPDKAFTRSEIVDATGIKPGSVGPTLVRLRERGRVDHRGNYWRVSDHENSVGAATNLTSNVADSHEDESFDYEDWQEHAVDPRKDRD